MVKTPSGAMQIAPTISPKACAVGHVQKRVLDVVIALGAVAILWPILALIALIIKATSRGPVLFKQTRSGLHGAPFIIYKFRTMRQHHDPNATQASRDDARITSVGRILRKTSLDELPQLLNILWGDMSLVGPRPHALAHDAYYGARIPGYFDRFDVKPGLTGLAQIHDFRGQTQNLDKMVKRITMDLHYIRSWSILSDLGIILQTPLSLLTTTQAY